ncbi:MAG: DUF427 domain-containing protein, partial [Thermoleophilia bacterium]|nr:DUF427 domain-containing protein [Thermoleophilia bacterium]
MESVWDYPRPPRLVSVTKRLQVTLGGVVIADTVRGHRVLETSHPPVYYFPIEDVAPGVLLLSTADGSVCEWKGAASYYDVVGGDNRRVSRGAWRFRAPTAAFEEIRDAVAFYPAPMDKCTVAGERVTPQPGEFYGG